MVAAAVIAAGMSLFVVVVMIAGGVRVIAQGTVLQRLNCGLCVTGHARIECDARLGKRGTCAAANATANQGLHTMRLKKTSQCAVSLSVGVKHLLVTGFGVHH